MCLGLFCKEVEVFHASKDLWGGWLVFMISKCCCCSLELAPDYHVFLWPPTATAVSTRIPVFCTCFGHCRQRPVFLAMASSSHDVTLVSLNILAALVLHGIQLGATKESLHPSRQPPSSPRHHPRPDSTATP